MPDYIHTKPGLLLRKVGTSHMIVEASERNANLSYVYNLNTTAARMWQLASGGGHTAASLAEDLAAHYDIPFDQALTDVLSQLETWRRYGLIE